MTRQEKQLLLVDLCGRLPYGVIGLYSWKNHEPYNRELTGLLFDELKSSWNSTEDSEFLPYLRPMSSMTEDELQRYHELCDVDEAVGVGSSIEIIAAHDTPKSLDYLNSIHVDYRGQIPKGLAIEVTEENNPYKEKDYEK